MRTTWEHGWFELETCPPHPSLVGCVHGDYVGWTEHTVRPMQRREAAGTIVPLILNFGAPYRVSAGDGPHAAGAVRGSFVAGLYDTWAAVDGACDSCALQVNLTPFAAFALLRTPLSLLTNASEELDAVLGASARPLIERLGNAPDWPARFALLDRFLRTRLADAPVVPSAMAQCWQTLHTSNGRVPIASLRDATGWSAKRLIATFQHYTGLTPRAVASVRRFEYTIARMDRLARGERSAPRGQWSTLALDCGYADQSHMIRDFARFAGCSPTAYLRARLTAGDEVVQLPLA